MISICIPIYNQEISNLINELTNQIRSLSLNIEIIVIDDGSEDVFENQNLLKDHTYIALQENVGRSKIRNLFVE
ncbi:MAG: glycosyltransferase, partial [Wenyingzhuangia sp.]